MIRVDPQPEPNHFELLVRQPGLKFLTGCLKPTTEEWNKHSYWREILSDLHEQYGGICAYTCHWIAYDTGARTVEHFLPKNLHPHKAYEWSNYRLVCALLNARKRTNEEMLDPFEIQNGWFVLDFPSLLVKPEDNLTPDLARQVERTIQILKLNDEATCKKNRRRYVELYCTRKISFEHLAAEAPFIALELQRQEMDSVEAINAKMGYN